ncbi:DUF6233 domain-containing protein [Streptomyces sp. NPDC047079]|uniref:DUF6233 domain-containing protein n=1 Tax=Streptomyces sp. NPDC047079 TaxID=3154607 RepID=UPI0033C4503C
MLGERRPSGWVLAKVREGRGPARGVLHTPDCEEAPHGAPLFDVEHALSAVENPGPNAGGRRRPSWDASTLTSPSRALPWRQPVPSGGRRPGAPRRCDGRRAAGRPVAASGSVTSLPSRSLRGHSPAARAGSRRAAPAT